MRARILLRNSTDRQARDGTIAAQRGPVRELARRLGATTIVEYIEEAVSGATPLDERDVMRRLLADAQPGDLVCAFDVSRLTRSDDWEDRYRVLGRLRKAGLRAATTDEGEIDFHSLGGRITAHVRGEIAAEERAKILARVTAGKAAAVEQGRKPQGATPYGLHYDRPRRAWSIDEPRAAVVRDIYARLVAGETCAKIAARLRSSSIAPPRRGWGGSSVWRIATSTTYRGEWSFAGRTIAVPRIVDEAAWQTVQAGLYSAQRRGLKRTAHVYLLDDGTGRCGYCGRAVQIRWGGLTGQQSYYVCRERGCGLRWRRTEVADAETWQRIRAALARPDLIEQAMAGARDASADAAAGEGDAAGFDRQLERLAGVEAAILTRFRRGSISETAMDRELDAIGRERAMLERSAQAAREAAARARASAAELDGLREAVRLIAGELDRADPAERRAIVRELRPDVRLDRDGIRITFRLRAPAATPRPVVALVSATCSCTENHCETEKAFEIAVVA